MLKRGHCNKEEAGERGADVAARKRGTDLPTVSIVITNRDYGHFLDDAIASVQVQTLPPLEVIVVDDGSQDQSEAVLQKHGHHIRVLRRPGEGQAAAFNAGAALAQGDIVIFLDADDVLRPDALEVIGAFWSPEFSVLCFALETLDAAGRSTGVHPSTLKVEDGDNRPLLLRGSSLSSPFHFAPTSGNAFSRAFLRRALPMPEQDWVLCADSWLLRAAALDGPFRRLDRVLGGYRIHGSNGFVRTDSFDAWTMGRGLRDLEISVHALESLAGSRFVREAAADGAVLEIALRLRALETHAHIAAWTGEPRSLWRSALHTAASVLRRRVPLSARLDGARSIVLTALPRLFGRRLADPTRDPVRLARSPRVGAYLDFERRRWPASLPYETALKGGYGGSLRPFLAEGWSGLSDRGACWSRSCEAGLDFVLEPAPGPLHFALTLALPEGQPPLRVSVFSGERRLWSGDVADTAVAEFDIDRDLYLPWQSLHLSLKAAPLRRKAWPLPASCIRFGLSGLIVQPRPPRAPAPVLRADVRQSAADLLCADPACTDWVLRADGSAQGQADSATLRFAVVGFQRAEIELVTAADTPSGWLAIRSGTRSVFSGSVTGRRAIRCALDGSGTEPHELIFGFAPAAPDAGSLGLETIRLIPRAASDPAPGEETLLGWTEPMLAPGQTVVFAADSLGRRYLGEGWDVTEEGGIQNCRSEADLFIALPDDLQAPTLTLSLRPALPATEDWRHLIGVSAEGEMIATGELLGEGTLTAALPRPARGRGRLQLTLHSVYMTRDGGHVSGLASVELCSLSLQAEAGPPPAFVAKPSLFPAPAFLDLVEALREAQENGDTDRLCGLRAELAGLLWRIDQRALETLALLPARIATLSEAGASVAALPLTAGEAAIADEIAATEAADDRDRLRHLLVGMLLVPAFRLPFAAAFDAMPALLLHDPAPLTTFLTREPVFRAQSDSTAYVAHLGRLLGRIDAVLAKELRGSFRHGLASQMLMRLRNTTALFGEDDLADVIRLRSRAIERLLVQSGAALSTRPLPCNLASRLRIGVFIRHMEPCPETWALLGMYRCLDQSQFEPVLITLVTSRNELEAGDMFGVRLSLDGLSVAEAVAAIRSLDLDLFILGAYIANWETVSAIAAHRLARIQINSCFNNPTTLGFRNFDVALAWKGTADAASQYVEELVESGDPMQCCFDFASVPDAMAEPSAALRRRIGVPSDAVLFTSGAVAQKIQPELLSAWAQILAGAPTARLVLYPYARVWAIAHSHQVFSQRVADAFLGKGVDPARVIILPEQGAEEVRALLRAADVYLDSFPYSGATTVCEALSQACPALTRTGSFLRGRTGAAWAQAFDTGELAAATTADYIAVGRRLARDAGFRAEMRARIGRLLETGTPPHGDFARFGAAISDALMRVATARSLRLPGAIAADVPARTPLPKIRSRSVAPVPRTQPQRAVVLGLARTGSTLLCDILAGGTNAMVDLELFHEEQIQYRSGAVSNPASLAERNADPVGWLGRHHGAAARAGYDLIAFKLFLFHDERVLKHVLADRSFCLVLVERENVLAQYASHQIACRTGQWILQEGESRRSGKVVFDAGEFENWERMCLRFGGRLEDLFARHGRRALRLEYSRLQEPETSRQISEWLGQHIPGRGKARTLRQNSSKIIDRFENPDLVRDYLAGRGLTHWAGPEGSNTC